MRESTKKDDLVIKPRGRPRAYEPDIALRQATDAFWKAGYAGTSLDDISAATGMNRPSLRAAFGDKHAIYVRTLVDYWDMKSSVMHDALKGEHSLKDALMRAYDAALAIYFSGEGNARGCFVLGTAITEAANDGEIQDIVRNGLRKLDACFEGRLRIARDKGELAKDADVNSLALLASATMHTIAVRARAGTSKKDLRKLAQKAVTIITR